MKKIIPPLFLLAATALAACREDAQDGASARRAEAVEASMDAEAARMVAAADSVRAAGERTADSLRAQETPKPRPLVRRATTAPAKAN